MKHLILAIALFYSLHAFAGEFSGSGGKSIVITPEHLQLASLTSSVQNCGFEDFDVKYNCIRHSDWEVVQFRHTNINCKSRFYLNGSDITSEYNFESGPLKPKYSGFFKHGWFLMSTRSDEDLEVLLCK